MAVTTLMLAAIIVPPAQAQRPLPPPSLATTAPGLLVIYTAKGDVSGPKDNAPNCTSTVEYRTPPGSGAADGTVNVTNNDHYDFTTAELTAGAWYDFRVQHTGGTHCDHHTMNTWSQWSDDYYFKPPHPPIPDTGVMNVTAKSASQNNDKTGSATTTVPRNGWIGIHFEPENRVKIDINLEFCSKKNRQVVNPKRCSDDLGIGKTIKLQKGNTQRWRFFRAHAHTFKVGDTIHLRIRTVSGHSHWRWDTPDTCRTDDYNSDAWDDDDRPGSVPCKLITLTVVEQGSDSEQESEQQQIEQQQEQTDSSASFDKATSSASEDEGTVDVTISLSPAPQADITLNYNTVGGTATDGSDFTISNSGSVEVSGGSSTASIPVAIMDDSEDESAETVVLTLTPGTGYEPGDMGTHTLTIMDNDDPPQETTPIVSVAGGEGVTEGGTAVFTLSAAPVPTSDITVNVSVSETGSFAMSGDTGAKQVTIDTGGSATVEVRTKDDSTDEPDGSVTVTVTTGSGYSPDNTAGTSSVAVRDNDDSPGQGDSTTQGDDEDEERKQSPDRAALVGIYDATGGGSWENSDNWNTDEPIEEWHGVNVDDENRVTRLDLRDNGLSGEFPVSELADMTELRELDLSDNPDLEGELPAEFMSLSKLMSLDISGTKLCVPEENEELVMWLEREEFSFISDNDAYCGEEGETAATAEGTQDGGGGGCAVASGGQKGVFPLVLAVFVLAAAVSCSGRLRRP